MLRVAKKRNDREFKNTDKNKYRKEDDNYEIMMKMMKGSKAKNDHRAKIS